MSSSAIAAIESNDSNDSNSDGPHQVSHEVDVVTYHFGKGTVINSDGLIQIETSPAASVRKGINGRHRGWSAIEDARYDKLLQILQGAEMVPPSDPDYKSLHRLWRTDKLMAQLIFDPALGVEETRIVDKQSKRIVTKTSDINNVLKFFYENNGQPGARTLMGLCNRYYCGIGKHQADEFVSRQDKAERKRAVLFSKTVSVTPAHRPMQHVQIDIVDCDCVSYGSKSYEHILLVQCLFSRFIFARALVCRERGLVTRHLMDIFSCFGPPECYQTFTGSACVDSSMPDVAHMFHVDIHCFGRSGLSHSTNNEPYLLRELCLTKSSQVFGSQSHWVEILPAVVMQRNQQLHPAFKSMLSPFQVMFGREPWRNEPRPPWLEDDDQPMSGNDQSMLDDSSVAMPISDSGIGEEDTYWKRSLCITHLRPHSETQKETNSKAKQLLHSRKIKHRSFEPGDQVYVRNTSSGRSERYVKATVIETSDDGQWPYHVELADRRRLTDGTPHTEWVSFEDITAVTMDLDKRRTVNGSNPDQSCQCKSNDCTRLRSSKCEFQLHRFCCRLQGNSCPVHDKITYPPKSKKRKLQQLNRRKQAALACSNLRRSDRPKKPKLIDDLGAEYTDESSIDDSNSNIDVQI